VAGYPRTLTPGIRCYSPAPGIDLYHGDCRTVVAYLQDIGSTQTADLVLTDPPYGIGYRNARGKKIANDEQAPLWCIPLMEACLKPDSAMLCFTGAKVHDVWQRTMEDAGFRVTCVDLDKGRLTLGDRRAGRRFGEHLLVGYKGTPRPRRWVDYGQFNTMSVEDTVVFLDYTQDHPEWEMHIPMERDREDGHPTPKPPLTMERALMNYTDVGDLVLDPFMGGSPVGIAALRLQRRYIGIEMDPEHYNRAVRNLQREVALQEIVCRARSQITGLSA